jgi:sugar lactone lactonase YvrE
MENSKQIKTLANGLGFGESPRWHEDRLWFANWGVNEVTAHSPDGQLEVICTMPSFPFSIDWNNEGQMLVVSDREKQLLWRSTLTCAVPDAKVIYIVPGSLYSKLINKKSLSDMPGFFAPPTVQFSNK